MKKTLMTLGIVALAGAVLVGLFVAVEFVKSTSVAAQAAEAPFRLPALPPALAKVNGFPESWNEFGDENEQVRKLQDTAPIRAYQRQVDLENGTLLRLEQLAQANGYTFDVRTAGFVPTVPPPAPGPAAKPAAPAPSK